MKPIFEPERLFLNKKLNINLPTDCWRDSSKIYLDINCKKPIYTFKVNNGEIRIIKDKSEEFIDYQQIKLSELIQIHKEKLLLLEQNSINKTLEYILNHPDYKFVISHSGGKDSTVTYEIWKYALNILKIKHPEISDKLNWEIVFSNTSNETIDTFKYIKQELPKDKLIIINPEIGFYQWIKNVKNYFVPSVYVRNCCSVFKEGQITKFYDKNDKITMVLGLRKYESAKRAKYDYVMDHDFRMSIRGNDLIPKNWINFAPIVEWKDEDVWLYLLLKNIKYNNQYNLGFNRCGCLICPYQRDYIDLLIQEYYSSTWSRWAKILEKNYDIYDIKDRLKWSIGEWINGKWKTGTSKEQEIIQKTATDARIKELAEIKGISEAMAKKFFNKKCKCGKKMNPTELAMFYKLYGRFEDVEVDDRELLCKKCLCKNEGMTGKEYQQNVIRFMEFGCNLF